MLLELLIKWGEVSELAGDEEEEEFPVSPSELRVTQIHCNKYWSDSIQFNNNHFNCNQTVIGTSNSIVWVGPGFSWASSTDGAVDLAPPTQTASSMLIGLSVHSHRSELKWLRREQLSGSLNESDSFYDLTPSANEIDGAELIHSVSIAFPARKRSASTGNKQLTGDSRTVAWLRVLG